MGQIDNQEVVFLTESILKKYKDWYKIKYSHIPPMEDFRSYLPTYRRFCELFEDILDKNDIITDNALRKLFYYAKNENSSWFNDSILDVFYKYFSGKTRHEFYQDGVKNKFQMQISETFEMEFYFWKDLNSEYYIDLGLFMKVIKLLDISTLDDERKAFVIVNSVHFGDRSIKYLITANTNNKAALFPLYLIALNGGVREGWRAEYFLSQMNHNILLPFLYDSEKELTDPIKIEKIYRIRSNTILEYLKKTESDGSKLAAFATQVINQLEGV